jgi:hypothetical protein
MERESSERCGARSFFEFRREVTLGNVLQLIGFFAGLVGVWATMDRRLTLVELRGTFAADEAREVRRSLSSLVENQAVLTRAVDRMAIVLDEHTKDSRAAVPAAPAGTR